MVQRELNTQAGFFEGILRNILACISAFLLFGILIVTNVVQVLSLSVRPFSIKLFKKMNCLCAGSWWGLVVFFQEKLYGVKPVFTGDELPSKENAFLVVNHQGMTDIVILLSLAIRKKMLGNLKFFVKDVLKYVPGVGWGMLFLDCLFLKRNWERDEQKISGTFGRFTRENIPLWLVSFVEGTRLTAKKLSRSQNYAREHGLPHFENVLLPRTKGFVAVVKNLREHLDAIYDVTVTYPQGIPTLWQLFQGWIGEFHLHVRRFGINELPFEDKALAQWLLTRFSEKDRIVANLSVV